MLDVYYKEFLKAKKYIKERKYNIAEKILEELLKLCPKDLCIKFEYAKVLVKLKKYSAARNCFESMLNTKSKNYAVLELGKLAVNEGNIAKAREYFESLLNTPSKDYAMLELGILEESKGNIEKAREYFESLLNTSTKHYAISELFILAFLERDYDTIKELSSNLEFDNFKFVANLLTNNIDLNYNSYFTSQCSNYSIERAKEHVRLHLHKIENKKVHSVFNSDIKIEELFYEINLRLKNAIPHKVGVTDDYLIEFAENIGICLEQKTNIVKVITIHDTKNIITMYPVLNINKVNKISENNKLCKVKK